MKPTGTFAVLLRASIVLGFGGALAYAMLRDDRASAGKELPTATPWAAARHEPPSAEELPQLIQVARVGLVGGLTRNGLHGTHLAAVSVGRQDRPALVGWGAGASWIEALEFAAADVAAQGGAPGGALKVSLLLGSGPASTLDGKGRVTTIDRSLDGIWLPTAGVLFLPDEVLARRLVNSGGDLRPRRMRDYLAETGRSGSVPVDHAVRPGDPYRLLRFASFSADGPSFRRLFRGNVLEPDFTASSLLAAARSGGDYLLRHQREDGSFQYVYEPKWDGDGKGYNLLRHAGSSYALAELTQASGDPRYLEGARRGLEWLLSLHVRETRPEDAARGASFRAVVSPGEEAKLGGSALAILALLKVGEASGDASVIAQARPLAEFIRFQQSADGHFASKYFYGEPDPEPFESIYYPGEAILALARLHRQDPDGGWLSVAARGADWLIDVRDAGKTIAELPHDHWLLMGLEELHNLTGDDRYFEHSTKIATAIVDAQRTQASDDFRDWVGSFYDPPRSTPTATRAEGLLAAARLAEAKGLDADRYRAALARMTQFQLRCQLGPVSSMHLPRPDLAAGGFRRSLMNWQVRIDYVQHNVSALLGMRSLDLEEGE